MADDYQRRNAVRLLREKWATPSALAEELYMINSDEASRSGNAVSPVAQARAEQVASQAPKLPEPPSRPASRPPAPISIRTLTEVLTEVSSQLPAYRATSPIEALMPHSSSTVTMPFSDLSLPARSPSELPVIGVPSQPRRAASAYRTPSVSGTDITGWSGEPGSSQTPDKSVYRPRREPVEMQPMPEFQSISFTSSPLGGSAPQVGQPNKPMAPVRSSPFIGSSGEQLPVPAHVEFAATTERYPFAADPLAYPGAYSGMEREAGDPNPVNGGLTREYTNDDPFARKYYDLRFFLPDWDTALVPVLFNPCPGQVVDGSQSPVLQVLLYPGGPNEDPSPTDPVTVTILQLATNEIVPNGTWIPSIDYFGDGYYAQLPIWLCDAGSTSATTSGTGTG